MLENDRVDHQKRCDMQRNETKLRQSNLELCGGCNISMEHMKKSWNTLKAQDKRKEPVRRDERAHASRDRGVNADHSAGLHWRLVLPGGTAVAEALAASAHVIWRKQISASKFIARWRYRR